MLRMPPIFTQFVNTCWSVFKWSLLLAMAAVIVVGGYLYLRLDDEIRRQVEARIDRHYTGMDVHVGRARFEQDRGIAIFDIAIADGRPDPNPQPMLSIGEMYLSGKVRMEELVTGELPIDEIVVRRAALRAVRQSDGSWNVKSLLPLPQFGGDVPLVRIDDATLIIEDKTRATTPQSFHGIDLVLTPASSADAGGTPVPKHFHVEGCAAGAPACELRFKGELGIDDGLLDLTVTVARLEVSSQMIAALPGVPANSMAGVEMAGRVVDATLQIHREGPNQPLTWSADVAFDRGRVNHKLLPEPLTELRFQAAATPEKLAIKRLDAKCGSARLAIAAERRGWSQNAPIALAANVVGLQLDDKLPARMPESAARIWKRFDPRGPVDATLQLQFDGRQWRPQLTANCRGISLTDAEKFPYVVEQAVGQLVYQPTTADGADHLTLNLSGVAGARPVHIEADLKHLAPGEPEGITTDSDLADSKDLRRADERVAGYRGPSRVRRSRPHPIGWVKVSGSDIPIHERLIAAIPDNGQPFVRSLHPQGVVDFTFLSEWNDLTQPQANVSLDITLKDCAIQCERFPLPLRGVCGLVTARDWRWKLQDVEGVGASDSTIMKVGGEITPQRGGWRADLTFDTKNLPLDESLRSALSPGVRQAWEELRPQGQIDVTARVIHETDQPQPAVRLTLRPCEKTVSMQLAKFPYRLEEIEGEAMYEAGRLEFRDVLARHDREVFSAQKGVWNVTTDGGWQLVLSGCNIDRISPHRELIGALPVRLQKAIERLQPIGTFGVYESSLSFAKGPNSEQVAAAWDVKLDCHQAVLRGALPLQSVTGGVRLFGRDDSQLQYAAGELYLDSVIWKDVQFTNVHGPLYVDHEVCLLGEQATAKLGQPPRRITADAYGGSLASNVTIKHDSGPTYQIDLALGAADLARFVNERMGGPTDMNGNVSGRLSLSGSGSSLQMLNGTGELHVVDAHIYKLPLLVSMLKVPNLRNRTPDTTAFNRCDMKFVIHGDVIAFEQLNLLGDAVSLYGQGESRFDRRLDLVFYTLLEPAIPMPLWKTIAGQVSQQTLQLNVAGTLDKPEVSPETLPGVSQMLEQIQSGLQGNKDPEPTTARRNLFAWPR